MEEVYDAFRALCVRQPYASRLINGEKTIEVRSKNTYYRGQLLICASKRPEVGSMPVGCTVGIVELYDVKPVSDFTEEDWERTTIPPAERCRYSGFGWMMRNPVRVIEHPVVGQVGIHMKYFPKDTLIPYPTHISIDAESRALIDAQIEKK